MPLNVGLQAKCSRVTENRGCSAESISGDKLATGSIINVLLRVRRHYRHKSRQNGVARPKLLRLYGIRSSLGDEIPERNIALF